MHETYRPATLIKGKDRWYILFYQTNPETGLKKRFRLPHVLNHIDDIKRRNSVAKQLCAEINEKLPNGWPFTDRGTGLVAGIQIATDVKLANSERKKTIDSYNSMNRIFKEYCEKYNLHGMPICDFSRADAITFLDRIRIQRNLGNRSYNNYRDAMRALFNELKDREYITENPFADIRPMKKMAKKRRAFSTYEKSVVAAYIKENDKMLWLGLLLQYHCFIRPIELRRLRFRHFNLKEGLIRIEGELTKNWKDAIITIPDSIIDELRELGVERYRPNWFVFGEGCVPDPDKACGQNTLNKRHRRTLELLKKQDRLYEIKGLSFYSWKDTGALELFRKKVDILEIMRQLRHVNLSTTQTYCNSLYVVNKEIKGLDNDII